MDLDNRLKELNNLPVDRRMKSEIYNKINSQRTNRFGVWKEVVLLGGIAVIAFLLMFLPSTAIPQQQATNHEVEAIYAYDRSEEGKFFARPSTLYLGVEKIDDPQLNNFFENYTEYVQPSSWKSANYSVDVVVIRDGEEERWKLSRNGMLNFDTGTYYKAVDPDALGEMIVDAFYSGESRPTYIIIFILALALLTNQIPTIIYKKRNMGETDPLKWNMWFGVSTMLIYLSFIIWHSTVGPLYKPILIPSVILYLIVIHILLKRRSVSSFVHRIELTRYSVTGFLLILLFFTF